jgi:alpha-D-xyloside xylohydrolase
MRGLPMDFSADKNTYTIDDQFMFGPSIMVNPVTEYMYHTPPQPTVLIGPEYFKTNDGKPGLSAKYYKDNAYQNLGKEQVDPSIDVFWYTGRPDYVSDSMFAIRWEGKLVPKETGKHQFHLKSFDAKRIILNGETLPIVYTSVEQYTAPVELEAGKEYSFVVETENTSTGAARMRLFWKTPSIFAIEANKTEKEKTRDVYLPSGTAWYDFWTGKMFEGGRKLKFDAPKDQIPLLVRAGSIIPMGPFVEYTTQKPADPLEVRIYPGANGTFNLYEDENDNYNYEKGIYSTILFSWNDAAKELTIDERKGSFPGMLINRTIKIVLVGEGKATGIEIPDTFDKVIEYTGSKQVVKFE